MNISRWVGTFAVAMFTFALTGCDSGGGGTNEVVTDQTEIERFLAENPNFDEGMDDGSEEYDPNE